MLGSVIILSAAKLLSKPNEYDLFKTKLNLSSQLLFPFALLGDGSSVISVMVLFGRDWKGVSVRESRVLLGKTVSSRLGRILAAINGVNGDSVAKIPALQSGQLACDFNQASMQSTWKAWEQTGSVRTYSSSSNSNKQTAQSLGLLWGFVFEV